MRTPEFAKNRSGSSRHRALLFSLLCTLAQSGCERTNGVIDQVVSPTPATLHTVGRLLEPPSPAIIEELAQRREEPGRRLAILDFRTDGAREEWSLRVRGSQPLDTTGPLRIKADRFTMIDFTPTLELPPTFEVWVKLAKPVPQPHFPFKLLWRRDALDTYSKSLCFG